MMTRGIKGVTQRGKNFNRVAMGDIAMKASLIAAVLLVALALAGCGNVEKQQQAQEYERFLKDSLGTVAVDPPAHSDVH